MFDGLRGQRPPTPFAAPEEVRRRGRARKRRQVLLAGVAALAVAGSGGWAATQVIASSSSGHPQATAPLASGEQTPSTLQDAHDSGGRALTAADLGPGWEEAGHELLEGPWFWGECDGFPLSDVASLEHRTDVEVVSFVNGDVRLSQVVERFASPAEAQANLGEVREYLRRCSGVGLGDGPTPWYEFMVPKVSGDGALLVREEMHDHVGPAEPETTPRDADDAFDNLEQYIAVIVVGEFVTTLVSTEEEVLNETVPLAVERLP